MAEYNPSKIIKDGNTYNFRDTTKIPLAGSNEISGSLIPSTDGTVDLGSSTAQWNNAYIKSLAINGVATGDILTHNASEFVLVNDLSTVATSGSYDDLSNKPATMTPTSHTHGNITNDGKIGSNANKPLITTTDGTITTGSFGTTANTFCEGNDSRLSDARTPTAHTHSASDITSGLATVATSGSYNDLSNKPTIPTVNDGTLTIKVNGTTAGIFTANQATNEEINITIDDVEYATEAEVTEVLSEMNYLL